MEKKDTCLCKDRIVPTNLLQTKLQVTFLLLRVLYSIPDAMLHLTFQVRLGLTSGDHIVLLERNKTP